MARGDKSGPAEGTREDELGVRRPAVEAVGGWVPAGLVSLLLKLTRNRVSIGR